MVDPLNRFATHPTRGTQFDRKEHHMRLFSFKNSKQPQQDSIELTLNKEIPTLTPETKPQIELPPHPGINSMYLLYKKLQKIEDKQYIENPFTVADFNEWATISDISDYEELEFLDLLVYKSGIEYTTPNYTKLKRNMFDTSVENILGIPEFINNNSTENISLIDIALFGIYTSTKDFDTKRLNMYNLVHNLDLATQVIVPIPYRRYTSGLSKYMNIPNYKTHNPDILSFLEVYKLCKYLELGKQIQELPDEDGYAPYLYPEHNEFIDKILGLYAIYQETIQQYNSLSKYIDQNKTDMSSNVLTTLQNEKDKLKTNIDNGLSKEYVKYIKNMTAFNNTLTTKAKEQAQVRKDQKHLSILTTLGIKD